MIILNSYVSLPEGMYQQAGEMLPRTVDLDGKIENPGTCDDSGS